MLEVPLLHRVEEPLSDGVGPYREYTHPPEALSRYLSDRDDWTPVNVDQLPFKLPDEDENGFLVTFDDGYRSVLKNALPVLERYDASCVVFVTTAFSLGQAYPYELELASVLQELTEIREPDDEGKRVVSVATFEEAEAAYQRLRLPLKTRRHKIRERFLEELAELNDYRREEHQTESFLNPSELVELSRHPLVTVGAHGHYHVPLANAHPLRSWREMIRSRDLLNDILPRPVEVFSYAYGGHGIVPRALVRWSGFRLAFEASGEPIVGSSLDCRFRISRQEFNKLSDSPKLNG